MTWTLIWFKFEPRWLIWFHSSVVQNPITFKQTQTIFTIAQKVEDFYGYVHHPTRHFLITTNPLKDDMLIYKNISQVGLIMNNNVIYLENIRDLNQLKTGFLAGRKGLETMEDNLNGRWPKYLEILKQYMVTAFIMSALVISFHNAIFNFFVGT